MKLTLKLCLFLLVFISFGDQSSSITNYQIKRICKKEKRVSNCIKNLQEKKFNLEKGNLIEIPVKPYKR